MVKLVLSRLLQIKSFTVFMYLLAIYVSALKKMSVMIHIYSKLGTLMPHLLMLSWTFWLLTPYKIAILQIYSPNLWAISLLNLFFYVEDYKFNGIRLYIFISVFCALEICSKKLPWKACHMILKKEFHCDGSFWLSSWLDLCRQRLFVCFSAV